MMKRSSRDNSARTARRFFLVVACLAVLGFIILMSPFKGPFRAGAVFVARPFWIAKTAVVNAASGVSISLSSKSSLARENVALREEIAALRIEYWRSQIMREERDSLKAMLGRVADPDEVVLAYILHAPDHGPYDTLLLDVGVNAGILADSEVETDGGFVIGKVKEVSERESLAELYSSPGLAHDVVIGSAHIPAVAHGVGGGNIRIDIPKSTDVEVGDSVMFQGEVERLLGVIAEIIENSNTGITSLLLRLPVNPTELRLVGVHISA